MVTGRLSLSKSNRITFLWAIAILILLGSLISLSVYSSPVHTEPAAPLPPGGEVRNGKVVHKTLKGQSLYRIANEYLPLTDFYTTSRLVEELKRINSLERTLLPIGKELKIPVVHYTPLAAKTVLQRKDFTAKGIYITGMSAGTEKVLRLARHLKRLGGNTIVFDAKDMSGIIFYRSKVKLARQIGGTDGAPIRDLGKMICQLHREGIHVVARITLFHDQLLANKRRDLAVHSKSTGKPWLANGKSAWVDPSLKEVQDYNLDLAKELVAFGVDEIQLDYIRFPAMGDTDDAEYSYDETKTPKHKIITGFLQRAYRELHPLGVLVSIDVYGITVWKKEHDVDITGQRVKDLANYTDIISPMLYPSHFSVDFGNKSKPADEPYYFVYNGCKKMVEITRGTGVVVRPWLQAFPLKVTHFKEDYILKQIKAARDASTTGWLLWDAGNTYKVALSALESLNQRKEE